MPTEDVVIVPYADGPYLVRGPVILRDQNGVGIEAGRRTFALCRCGKSRMRPFCDGTHRLVRFQAPSHPESAGATPDAAPKRYGAAAPSRRLARAAGAPDAGRELMRDELRAAQRRLARILERASVEELKEADGTRDELTALMAQLGLLAVQLESGDERC